MTKFEIKKGTTIHLSCRSLKSKDGVEGGAQAVQIIRDNLPYQRHVHAFMVVNDTVAETVHLFPRNLWVCLYKIFVSGSAEFPHLAQVKHTNLYEFCILDEAVIGLPFAVGDDFLRIAEQFLKDDLISHKS